MDAALGGSPLRRPQRARPKTLGRAARALVRALFPALALAGALVCESSVHAQTPSGTTIRNRASVSYTSSAGRAAMAYSNTVDLVTAPLRTRSSIELTRLASGAPSWSEPVGPAVCLAGGAAVALPAPTVGVRAIDPLEPQPLVAAAVQHGGDPLFARLVDADRDLDASVRDVVAVTFRASATGDTETINLTETGVASGVFAGYVPTAAAAATPNDCVLGIARNAGVEVDYTDPDDASDAAHAGALLDPVGRVFDSASGALIDGARVTLVDAATNAPAAPLGDDGVSAFPATVVSGGEAHDTSGAVYRFASGEFRFPLVPAGRYRLVVDAPAGYTAPSLRAASELAELPGAPFALGSGSFGGELAVEAAFVRLDVPLDPVAATRWFLDKRAAVASAGVGDFVEYRLTLTRDGGTESGPVTIEDRLPHGVRYQPGSARLRDSSAVVEPVVSSDGRELTFELGDLGAARDVKLSYAVAVVPGAEPGEIVNVARAVGAHAASNEARASLRVVDDLFRDEAFLVGRVAFGSCGAADAAEGDGLGGVRVYLEDGRYSVSDDAGRFHFEGVSVGTHVVQLDLDSLPSTVEVVPCASDSRFAGTPFSRFVTLAPGALGRADFYVSSKAGLPGSERAAPRDTERGSPRDSEFAPNTSAIWSDEVRVLPVVALRAPLDAHGASEPPSAEMPEIDVDTLAPEFAWLWPPEDLSPAIPNTKVAVQHAATERVDLFLNGQPVSMLSFDGTATAPASGAALSRWRGLDLVDGTNVLAAEVVDPQGNVRRVERALHFAGPPVHGELVAAASRLTADGSERPVLALRFVDRWDRPARPGSLAEFRVDAPYRSWLDVERLRENPVLTTREETPTLKVGADGVALIELEPTTRAGEVVVTVHFAQGREQMLRAWLEPAPRDWVLVGLAEGTIGYDRVRGALEAAELDGVDADFYDGGRLAFFAKGKVKGSLLTVALNSDGGATPANETLGGTIDPDRYYTVYGDATEQRFDAATRDHVYLKLERRTFMAMAGDFETGLTITELGRYNRSLTGFKSERHGERVSYSAFAAQSDEAFVKDELRGDGTSGPYRLSRQRLTAGSDKLTLEVRDRFRPDLILSTRTLVRHFDYDIDYLAGSLFFKEPVPSRDFDFNPVYVIADYESRDAVRSGVLGGGRAAVQLGGDRAEVGVTVLRDGTIGANAALAATDLRYRFGAATELSAEVATSTNDALAPIYAGGASASSTGGVAQERRGGAYRIELLHRAGPRELEAYMKETDSAFGLGQQSSAERGTRRSGVAVSNELNPNWLVAAEGFRLESLLDGAVRDVVEGETRYQDRRRTASSGLRRIDEALPIRASEFAQSNEVTQAFAGGSWRFFDETLTTRLNVETDLKARGASADYPQRSVLGVDFALRPAITIFAEQELADGGRLDARTTRFGVKATPSDNTRVDSSINQALTEYGPRTYATLGLAQSFRVGESWALDVGGEETQTLREPGLEPLDTRVPLASGSFGADFSAAYVGAAYRAADWSFTTRLEHRSSTMETHRALLGGFFRERVAGRAFSAQLQLVDRTADAMLGGFDGRLRLGWASRPAEGRWLLLERADWIGSSFGSSFGSSLGSVPGSSLGGSLGTDPGSALGRNRRVVNNLAAHFTANARNEVGLQYAAKVVRFDGGEWGASGFLDLLGVEWRRQLAPKLDVGVHGSLYRAPSANVAQRGLGVDFGINVATNLQLAAGYNFAGFDDEDFSQARYTAAGPYVSFRLKVDQASLQELLRR